MQDDEVAAAVDHGLGLCRRVELVRYQSSGRVRRRRIHWKIGNDVLCRECGPLDGGFDRSFHPLRQENGYVADARLQVHMKIPIMIFRRESYNDVAKSR